MILNGTAKRVKPKPRETKNLSKPSIFVCPFKSLQNKCIFNFGKPTTCLNRTHSKVQEVWFSQVSLYVFFEVHFMLIPLSVLLAQTRTLVYDDIEDVQKYIPVALLNIISIAYSDQICWLYGILAF